LSLISKVAERNSFETDDNALSAGKRIQGGEFTRENLNAIFEWKTRGRGRSRIQKNSNAEIADALRLALLAKTDRAAVAVLNGLNGVQIPVASAILTAIDPARFTIIDFRALEALNIVDQPYITIDFYLAYLAVCRRIAKENRVTLRTLDRALWQWSKERGQNVRSL
jgi:hypothetical protein